ncbi:MAG: chemotaxis response regulator protein-glutamate methylesterase [Deltaproteobacteria bacterium]|nr:chemotaxis response regulator protein-glutamate methylesterase [Deltaproteobacteria bacterium]
MIKVLVIDDSAVVRQVLTRIFDRAPDIECIGCAPDPFVAREMIIDHRPDVLTLDIEMPRMDGLTFLSKLMRALPMPVVVVSSLTPRGSHMAAEALRLGAIAVLAKPGAAYTVGELGQQLVETVRQARYARVQRLATEVAVEPPQPLLTTTNKIFAIGASTGGTIAIEQLLRRFPHNAPGTLIVQHMPAYVTENFAQRLDGVSLVKVREAKDGDPIMPGVVLIAPGDHHMMLRRSGARYFVEISQGPPVNRHRPAVDVLFRSVAQTAGPSTIAALLTGMGADGAQGLLALREAGAKTIAQDEGSSVVFGMPRVAIELGAAERVLPLDRIAAKMFDLAQGRSVRASRSVVASNNSDVSSGKGA